jgi:ankyrin repeat protein
MAEALLEHGADPDSETRGRPLLHEMVTDGSFEAVAVLLEHDADVEAKDRDGDTALYVAVDAGETEKARLLLDHGAVVTFRIIGRAIQKALEPGMRELLKVLQDAYAAGQSSG